MVRATTTLNGRYLALDPAVAPPLVAELTTRGYTCQEEDDLVRRAQGA